jgi:hypothetical protein
MLKITKQDIWHLPIEQWHTKSIEELSQTLKENPLWHCQTWLLPQLVNWFGSWELKPTAKETVLFNCNNPLKKSLFMLTKVPRSLLVQQQNKSPDYSKLTPLVLFGLRSCQGVSYNRVRQYHDVSHILEPDLASAFVLGPEDLETISSLTREELLGIREIGLLTKSGRSAGTAKNPESTWQLTGIQHTIIGNLPKLTQTVLCQIWLSHPKIRRPQMILDPTNWDTIPAPLVGTEIFKAPTTTPTNSKNIPLLW